jgi:invasion protein IalB
MGAKLTSDRRSIRRAASILSRARSATVILPLLLAHAANAADPEPVDSRQEPSLEGLYGDWSLYGLQENGNIVCYLASGLERSSDPSIRRRPPRILITNRPADGAKGVVSVDPGYIYEDGSTVLLAIGRRLFHLFTSGAAAWAQDSEDPQIIAAIRAGSTLVVTGRMKDGPATTDTFSLKGFGPALTALDHACPMAGPALAPAHRKRKKQR